MPKNKEPIEWMNGQIFICNIAKSVDSGKKLKPKRKPFNILSGPEWRCTDCTLCHQVMMCVKWNVFVPMITEIKFPTLWRFAQLRVKSLKSPRRNDKWKNVSVFWPRRSFIHTERGKRNDRKSHVADSVCNFMNILYINLNSAKVFLFCKLNVILPFA